jgi:O-antigen/teichoic acid export membrane protein
MTSFWKQWTDSFARNVLKIGLGSIGATAATILAIPVLSRAYSPQAFGYLGTFTAIVSVATCVATGRFELAIALPEMLSEAMALRRLARMLVAACSLLLLAAMPWAYTYAGWFGQSKLALWLALAPVALLLNGLIQIETAMASRTGAYSRVAAARITQAIVCIVVQLAASPLGHAGLLVGVLLGGIAQLLLVTQWHKLVLLPESPRFEDLPALARKHSSFPLFLLPAAVIDTLTGQLPFFLGALWFSSGFVGFYMMAARAISIPSSLVSGSVSQVFYQEFPRLLPNFPEARRLLFRTWGQLLLLGAIPFMLVAYFAEPLFVSILGESWRPAAAVATVIAPMVFAMFISSPTSGAMIALGHTRLPPVFSALFVIYRIGGFWMGHLCNDYLLGLACIAAAEIATILVYNIIILWSLRART